MFRCVPDRIGIWKCWLWRRDENQRTLRKTSRSKGENHQSGFWTRALQSQIPNPIRPKFTLSIKDSRPIGHFRIPKALTFKMRLGAQPFLWKWVLFSWERKMISISKAEPLPSFWNRGPGELGNGLLVAIRANQEHIAWTDEWEYSKRVVVTYLSQKQLPVTIFLFSLINNGPGVYWYATHFYLNTKSVHSPWNNTWTHHKKVLEAGFL